VILDDVKEKVQELEKELVPLIGLIKRKKIDPKGSGAEYVRTRFHLILNYSMNVNFYLILKSQRAEVKNHPVIKRLIQYKQMIQDLDAIREMLLPEIELLLSQADDTVLKKSKERKLLSILKRNKPLLEKPLKSKSVKRKQDEPEETLAEKKVKFAAANKVAEEEKPTKKAKQSTPVMEDEEDQYSGNESMDDAPEDENEESRERRAISRQILKNRGLTPHRAKKYGNPRVKNRSKYDKAVKKWRTQVPPARREIDRYGGEKSGIRAGIVKSVKIK
jgi:U3 small nucleolar RNA-associated protein 3